MDEREAVQEAILEGKHKQLASLLRSLSREAVAAPIDEEGTTLLHLAANTDNPQLLRLLLKAGVPVNSRNGDGFTALHVAAMWGRGDSVSQLLHSGGDPAIRDNEDMTALDYAESEGHSQVAALLQQWVSPQHQEENNPHTANTVSNTTTLTPTQPAKTHHSPPPPTEYVRDPTVTAELSMAETFVSMHLNLTQGTIDLTEVTELSQLTETTSIIEIFTPCGGDRGNTLPLSLPPPPVTPLPTHPQDSGTSSLDNSDPTVDKSSGSVGNHSQSLQGQRKSCVRRLDLTPRCLASPTLVNMREIGTANEKQRASEQHSLLALDLRLNTSNSPSHEENDSADLFITALEPSCPPSSPPLSPSKAAKPFLAESLRKIELRRRRKAQRDEQSLTTPSPPSLEEEETVKNSQPTLIPPHIQRLSNEQLRKALLERGEQPGPVTDTTRSAYLLYLVKLEAGVQPSGNTGYKGYRYELSLVLNGTSPIPDFSSLEHEIFHRFRSSRLPASPLRSLSPISSFPLPLSLALSPQPSSPRSKRDWSTKTHFNYLLLDVTRLKQHRGERRESLESFREFVEAVFYVGKGKNARSLQHLKEAREKIGLPLAKVSKKIAHIWSVWESGQGVVPLHVFHNTTAEEAFCREACMIDAIGLEMLTNIQKGQVYGKMAGWASSRRRQFGVYLLHKAFLSFLLDPPQPVGPHDL